MTERSADPLLQLEIDEWILDYLIFSATKALLDAYKASKDGLRDASDLCERASVCIQLVDCEHCYIPFKVLQPSSCQRTAFFTTFCAMHPAYNASLESRFRLRLLKFTAMFTKRLAPEEATLPSPILQDLQHQRRTQAIPFRSGNTGLAYLEASNFSGYLAPIDDIEVKKERMDHGITIGNQRSKTHDLFQPAISLFDTIPLFMAVSAAQISMQEGTITDTWMRLAAGYMAQAVAEQYLIYGSQRQEIFQEAFSWGFDPDCKAEEGSDDFQINAMFWGVDAVVDGWDGIRDEHARAVSLESLLPCAQAHRYCAIAHTTGRS